MSQEPDDRYEDEVVGEPERAATVSEQSREWLRVKRGIGPSDTAFVVPRRFKVRVEETGLPLVVLEVELCDSGTPWCRSLTVEKSTGPGVTGELLRSLPVRRLMREAMASAMEKVERAPDGSLRGASMGWADREYFLKEEPRPRASTPIVTDELLKRVAEVYRANPKAPARAVHEDLRTATPDRWPSRATAGRYIQEARRRGFLGPATPRKAGEINDGGET